MEWIQLWAGITFAAQNGDVEGLLTAAAAAGCTSSTSFPGPAGSRPGAPHGIIGNWPLWPADGGCGCAS